jgi:hypothetical protein
MIIIGISGKAMSGKDTSANYLKRKIKNRPVHIVRFAGGLKVICSKCFNIPLEDFEKPDIKKNRRIENGMTLRDALQHLGTNVFRNMDSNCWINWWKSVIEDEISKQSVVIVPDVRFRNEADLILSLNKQKGYQTCVIRLCRNVLNLKHVSECHLDTYKRFDYVLENQNMFIKNQNLFVYDYVLKKFPELKGSKLKSLLNKYLLWRKSDG